MTACVLGVWANKMKTGAREREREGVLTGRKGAKVHRAHVSGSTSPLCARWKTWHSRRFLQPGPRCTSVEAVIFSWGCYFHFEHGNFQVKKKMEVKSSTAQFDWTLLPFLISFHMQAAPNKDWITYFNSQNALFPVKTILDIKLLFATSQKMTEMITFRGF